METYFLVIRDEERIEERLGVLCPQNTMWKSDPTVSLLEADGSFTNGPSLGPSLGPLAIFKKREDAEQFLQETQNQTHQLLKARVEHARREVLRTQEELDNWEARHEKT